MTKLTLMDWMFATLVVVGCALIWLLTAADTPPVPTASAVRQFAHEAFQELQADPTGVIDVELLAIDPLFYVIQVTLRQRIEPLDSADTLEFVDSLGDDYRVDYWSEDRRTIVATHWATGVRIGWAPMDQLGPPITAWLSISQ